MPTFKETLPHFEPTSRTHLRQWLSDNHTTARGIWLVLRKKGTEGEYISYSEVVDEVLCFGWIDSVSNTIDATRYKLMLTPRKPGSGWSKVNKVKLAQLAAQDLIQPAGLQAIERAKQDGSWEKLDLVETLAVPDDLAAELTAHTPAAERFAAFSPSSRRAILDWLNSAKTPATRTKRLREIAELAALGIRANFPADAHKRPPKP